MVWVMLRCDSQCTCAGAAFENWEGQQRSGKRALGQVQAGAAGRGCSADPRERGQQCVVQQCIGQLCLVSARALAAPAAVRRHSGDTQVPAPKGSHMDHPFNTFDFFHILWLNYLYM